MATTYVFPACAGRRHLSCPGTFCIGGTCDLCSCVCHDAERHELSYVADGRPLERWRYRS